MQTALARMAPRLSVPANLTAGTDSGSHGLLPTQVGRGRWPAGARPQDHFDAIAPGYRNTPLNEQRHFFAAIDAALALSSRANAEEGRPIGRCDSAGTSQMRAAPGVRLSVWQGA